MKKLTPPRCGLAYFALTFICALRLSAATFTWTDGAGNFIWNTNSLNWTTGSGNVAWINPNNAVFGSTGVGGITVSGTQTVSNLTVSAAGYALTGGQINLGGRYTSFQISNNITIGSVISGFNELDKSGPGTLTLLGTNNYTGGTSVTEGNLVLNAGAFGVGIINGYASVYFGGTLTIQGNTNQTSFPIAPSDTIIVSSPASLVVAGAGGTNGYAQATYGGSIYLSTSSGVLGGNIGATVTTPDGSTLLFGGTNGGIIASSSTSYSVLTNRFDANITLKNVGGVPCTLSAGTNSQLNISGTISDFPGYAGTPVLFTGGGGTVMLSASNSYVGPNIVSNVTVSASHLGNGGTRANLGAAGNSVTNLIFNNGALRYTGTNESTDRGMTIQAGTTATFEVTTSTLTLSNIFPATTGALIKTGAGTLVVAGTNNYTGTTTVSNGTLLVNSSLPNTAVNVQAGGLVGGLGQIVGSLNLVTGAGLALTVSPGATNGLTVNGVTTLNGSIIVSPAYYGAALQPGTYTVLTYKGGLIGTNSFIWLDPTGQSLATSIFTNGNKIQVAIATKPTVTTQIASGVGATNATINGTVNPNGLSATSYFEYGLDATYGTFGGFSNLPFTNATISVIGLAVNSLSGAAGANWTYLGNPSGISTNFWGVLKWTTLASSADGTHLVAGDTGFASGVWTSTNSGLTWLQGSNGLAAGGIALASSWDGTHLLSASGLGIYYSTNSGGTWLKSDAPIVTWQGIASSADGTYAAALGNDRFWTSTNGGINWTWHPNTPTGNAAAIASSADGTHLAAVVGYDAVISMDGGATWSTNNIASTGYGFVTIASSADGTRLVAGMLSGGVYISTNSGINWQVQTNLPNPVDWTAVTSSADGMRLAAARRYSGGIWTSTNGGANWAQQTAAPVTNDWYSIASSADGTHLVAGTYGKGFWASTGSANNLTPTTTYHYQLVALNNVGIGLGGDQTFTTGIAAPAVTTGSTSGLTATNTTLNGAVNPGGGVTAAYFRYGWTTNYGFFSATNILAVATTNISASNLISGLMPGTTYHYQLVANNSAGTNYGTDLTFTTIPVIPVVATLAANSITATNATLNGTVNSGGGVTAAYFQYGLTTNYGSFSATNNIAGTNANSTVTNLVYGLNPSATYHFRLVAGNSAGTAQGNDLVFTTSTGPLTVATLAASGVTAINATLNGTVYPGVNPTSAYFQYGLTTNYGNSSAVNYLPATNTTLSVSSVINNLNPSTLYHYQLVASNSAGIARGVDLSLATPVGSLTVTTLAASGLTLSNATLNGSVIPFSNPANTYFAYGTDTNYGNLGGFATLPAANAALNVPGWVVSSLTGPAGNNWQQTGPSYPLWQCIAASGDGTHLVAGSLNGGIYTTTNNSGTWVQLTNAPTARWQSIASSADGTHLAGAIYNGSVYTSTNSGITWTQQTNAPSTYWSAIVSSADGTHLAAAISFGAGGIYTSTNSGFTWTHQTNAPFANWFSIASSMDGSRLAAAGGYTGVWVSTDGGVTWVQQTNVPNQYWSSIVLSSDGTRLAISSSQTNLPVLTSTNGGATWIQSGSPALSWTSLTASADGSRMAALVSGSGIWISTNSGSTWIQGNAPSNTWTCLASSADGSRLAVSSSGAGIWTSTGAVNLLNLGATYHYQLVGMNSTNAVLGGDLTFKLLQSLPIATTLPATNIALTNATLNGTVNPQGVPSTAWFQYGTTTSYGSVTLPVSLPGTNTTLTVSNLLSGLVSGTTYHFQLVVSNSAGTALGGDLSFTTGQQLPAVTTLAASSISASNAILNGTVNPQGALTTAWFQYGTSASYGSVTPSFSLPGTNTTLTVSNLLSGLVSGTTYHFQLVVSNSAGTALGGDFSFTSGTLIPVATTLAATGVNATNATLNGVVNPGNVATTGWFEFGLTTNYGFLGGSFTLPATNTALNLPGFTFSSLLGGSGTNWSHTTAPASNWVAIASSADGIRLAAADVSGSGIWTSTDSGATWSQQTNSPSSNWETIAASADGTKLFTADNSGVGIWYSTNSGVAWHPGNAPSNSWNAIVASADGTHVVAASSGAGLWSSTDSGVTWRLLTNAPVGYTWSSVASSTNGTRLVALTYGNGIWTSTDSGTHWTRQTNAPAQVYYWGMATLSADGTKVAATDFDTNGIYTSTDSGVTWTHTSAPGLSWNSIASSRDGTRLAATAYGSGIWTSVDSGLTWAEQASAPVTNGWYFIASSADGSKLAAATLFQGIWTSTASAFTLTPGTTYHYQLVANNSNGTGLGGDLTFTTSSASTNQLVSLNLSLAKSPVGGPFQLNFTNLTGLSFTVLGTTNLALPVANWTVVGLVIETPAGSGHYQYTNFPAANQIPQFYRVRSP